MQSSQSTCIS